MCGIGLHLIYSCYDRTGGWAIAERPARRSVSVEKSCCCTNNANRSRASLRSTFSICRFSSHYMYSSVIVHTSCLVVKTSSAKTKTKTKTGRWNIKRIHIAHYISQSFMNVVKQPSQVCSTGQKFGITFSQVYETAICVINLRNKGLLFFTTHTC